MTPQDKPLEYTVVYGDRSFRYHLCYVTGGKNNAIKVHVHPSGMVQVDAPATASTQEIKAAVQRRARWILKHLDDIEERGRYVLPRQWVSGESQLYLGRRYVLKVIQDDSLHPNKPECKLKGGQLQVRGKQLTPERARRAVERWYRDRAQDVFQRRLALMVEDLPWVKETPAWRVMSMKTQWGSCSPDGTLVLNPDLVKAPTRAIDYVLLHELCHIKEHNHSARFYGLLSRYMANWRAVKEQLDGNAELYLN